MNALHVLENSEKAIMTERSEQGENRTKETGGYVTAHGAVEVQKMLLCKTRDREFVTGVT